MAAKSTPKTKRNRATEEDRLDPFNLPPGLEVKGAKQTKIEIRVSFATKRSWLHHQGIFKSKEAALIDLLIAKGIPVEVNARERGGIR